MPEVGIITDSIACLPASLVAQYELRVVPLNIYCNGNIYREGVDISPSEAYDLLDKDPEQFTTSPASAGDYLEAYREMSSRYRNILCITLSSGLSTLYDMACVARQEAAAKLPGTRIEVLDTINAAAGEGIIVLAAARAAAAGHDMDEVIRVFRDVREKTSTYGLFETIRHVYRTGRIPRAVSQLGAKISIKPVFHIDDGKVKIIGASHSRKNGQEKLLDIMRRKAGDSPRQVIVSHAGDLDAGENLKQMVTAAFNCDELWLSDFSPIMGYATGRGTLVLAFRTGD